MLIGYCPTIGSAAEESGVKPGDELISVNKQDISQLTHLELVRTIRKVRPILFLCEIPSFIYCGRGRESVACTHILYLCEIPSFLRLPVWQGKEGVCRIYTHPLSVATTVSSSVGE